MNPLSVFEIFKIGIGPSSSHTMGPWNASKHFVNLLEKENLISQVVEIKIELYGSLAKTGKGHGTDLGLMLGLMGYEIESFETHTLYLIINKINETNKIQLNFKNIISFNPDKNIYFKKQSRTNQNSIVLTAQLNDNQYKELEYISVGGGFIELKNSIDTKQNMKVIPYPINSAKEMVNWSLNEDKSIAEISFENELCWNKSKIINKKLNALWSVMLDSIYTGCITEGILPGGLNVKRRAHEMCTKLLNGKEIKCATDLVEILKNEPDQMRIVTNWVSCFALAVNEVNASYGKIVTAPTNGAAGVIPSVLMYNICFNKIDNVNEFLLVAAEIGMLFKKGATLSAAYGGCQAEIGVASAMAAGALTHTLGGSIYQVLMASEIAMEHHLGLTCDPIGGLVQIPCIERNTMGAIKAITASQLALNGNPKDALVSLDDVISAMWETGKDMLDKYKETSEGGLAIQVPVSQPEC